VLIDRKFFRLFWLALVVKDFCIAKLRAPSMIKQTLKRLLRQLGWDIHRFDPESSSTAQILAAINHVGAGLVFDIGANKGQFAKDLRSAGYTGTIVSFEPLSEAHLKLEANSRGDAKWLVHTRAALGDCDGEVEINLAGNSVSSSILPMLEAHSSAARQSIYVGSERAPLARLDSLSHKYITSSSSFFVNKLDNTDSNCLFHISNSESSKRWVFVEGFNNHWFLGNQLDNSGFLVFDFLGFSFNFFTCSSVDFAE